MNAKLMRNKILNDNFVVKNIVKPLTRSSNIQLLRTLFIIFGYKF
ncbi:hypothetical protein SCHRY_v1c09520 [Spiroplasma chrysopicola DF-1]|uniref:Uncharacterized protein n=1 Tax=Spiroplasma chrysopicola DF-1 TaxID=1276227 RepID=R4UC99_9MOLU|nr:hypothetical protein SCHRY_v1c09520 [Spiroplasma chrysopicola DF-1]